MKVLTIYAHPDPRSFCHGVLDRFTDGLRDAGHESEVIDLHAIGFDPVIRDRDTASYISADVPNPTPRRTRCAPLSGGALAPARR